MIRVPAKHKKSIQSELKKFLPVVHNLVAKGKGSSEDDARIVINDILSDVLGYDKYNELKTEQRQRNGRLDYLVKLTDGPNSKKKNRSDFIIEAKAANVRLSQTHVNQALSYCLTSGIDFFWITNAVEWRLYRVKRSKSNPDAELIFDADFRSQNSADSFAEEFYIFSKASYLAGDWNKISEQAKATDVSDIVAVLLSQKMIKKITNELEKIHSTKISDDVVKDIIENQIVKSEFNDINKSLLKKLNKKIPKITRKRKKRQTGQEPATNVVVEAFESITHESNQDETEEKIA